MLILKRLLQLFCLALTIPMLMGFSLFGPNYNDANALYDKGAFKEAFAAYQSALKTESSPSIQAAIRYQIGKMYLDGEGTSRSVLGALGYFEAVAKAESRVWRNLAHSQLGEIYADKSFGQLDIPRAVRAYEEVIQDGDEARTVGAYLSLASIFSNASAAPIQTERVKAAEYLQACIVKVRKNQQCKDSLDLLSDYPDVRVAIDSNEYLRTSTKDLAPAGMASAYKLFGQGEFARAFPIFKWHAMGGNAEAQLEVARSYLNGHGVAENDIYANGWIYLSAKNGNVIAQREYGVAISTGKVWGRLTDALFWLDVAGKQGDADSFNEMGRIWLNPVDESKLIKRDPGKAFAYISRAAEMGSVLGISNLGFLYLNGIGVTQNLAVARQLLEKAAQMGELNARALLLQNFGAQPVGESDKKRTNSDPKASASQVGAQSAATGVTMVEKVTERIIERVAERPVEKPSPVEIFSKSSPSVFTLIAVAGGGKEMSQGSAVAISNGVYVTNCHVIKDMTTYGAKIGGAVKLFRLLKGAPAKDVCIIGGDAGIPAISGTRKFQDLKVGEKVYAIGTPKGLANTFSEGLISGLRVIDGVKKVQTTASITNGSSGGALLDEFGRLVGITTSGMKEGNLNFAISADEVFELLGQ